MGTILWVRRGSGDDISSKKKMRGLTGSILKIFLERVMRKALAGLKSMKDALAQQGKGSSTVHHPFDELDFRHLTFDLSIIDGKG